ncbi:DivIVA domain-containing protein [Petrocella sp. FN5]|uniref:DivIVA domain-containing protein n=1 Tax=Petrocella sp. FN5 TaxID=3032002 RepID=UPI0023DAA50D|nr:DivIVA domain-containing protein [Petrocella sp. FN5]MDF1616311.1 DivIVA domain-containing protein [Petrocella sp. FN5]
MARLTPIDIESKTFTKSVSGYNNREVKTFLREVLVNYEQLYKENIELNDKVNMLNEGIQYYKTIEDVLQNTLIQAEKMAEETKNLARKKAEQIIKEAEINAQAIVNEGKNEVYSINKKREELIKQYDASKIQIKHFLNAQLEMTEKNELELLKSINAVPLNGSYTFEEDVETDDEVENVESDETLES